MKFIKSKKLAGSHSKHCIFCQKLSSKKDAKNLVLYRGKTGFIVLNLYPYANGHMMAVPKRHVPDFSKLTNEEMLELIKLVRLGVETLKKAFKPDGFNIGVNLGKVAGAGVTGHLHVHIVPRWLGDTNFMPAFAEVRLIPQTLKQTYLILKKSVGKI
jgi:ATP adenylyltransferase